MNFRTIFILLLLVLASHELQAQNSTVIIKSIEVFNGSTMVKSELHVIDFNGQTSKIPLKNYHSKNIAENMKVVKDKIDQYLSQGFKIETSEALSFGTNAMYIAEHTYILLKEN